MSQFTFYMDTGAVQADVDTIMYRMRLSGVGLNCREMLVNHPFSC